MIKLNKFKITYKSIIALILAICMVFTPNIIDGISEAFNSNKVYAAMQVGTGGTITGTGTYMITGGILDAAWEKPVVRVGLYRDKDTVLEEDQGLLKIYNRVKNRFADNKTGSIYMVNAGVYDSISNKKVSVAEANTSSKTLSYIGSAEAINNMVRMSGGKPSNGVYYAQLVGMDKASLSNWKSIATNTTASIGAWNYITTPEGTTYKCDVRINEIFNPENLDYNNVTAWNEANRNTAFIRYLDMLMTLYTIASGSTKSQWEKAINDYVKSENLQGTPVTVCIDGVVVMSLAGDILLLPTIDYVNFAAGIETNQAINGTVWATSADANSTSGNTYNQIIRSTQNSISASPTAQRISDAYTATNPFSHGQSALTNGILRTSGNVARWASDPIAMSYINMFRFNPPGASSEVYGFNLLPAPIVGAPTSFAEFKATPDNKVVASSLISEEVLLTITSVVPTEELGNWENIIKTAQQQGNDFRVRINTTRNSTSVAGNGSYSPNVSDATYSPSKFKEFIYGREDIVYSDTSTVTIGISEGQRIVLNYNVSMTITCGATTYNYTGADSASFIKKGDRIGYTSTPEAYSELKNYGSGSNNNGRLSEDWDAMAGIPSTEQLYFAAGGSEFIVDVTLEYIQNQMAKRTYDSWYSGTSCEFKDGDTWNGGTIKSSPAGASSSTLSISGHSGGTITASWSGTTRWTGSVSGWQVTNTWDDSKYNTAVSQANAFVTALKTTTQFTHISVSDKLTRNFNFSSPSASASVTTSSNPHNPGSNGSPAVPGTKDSPGSPEVPGTPGSDNQYSVVVTATMPAHSICGPCCSHNLPEIHDTWAQTFTYDSMKITDVHVWKIDQAAINGLADITGKDIVSAEIVQGEPNIFYNIALKNDANFVAQDGKGGATGTSSAGRVRYTISPEQHDEVTYSNGVRATKCDGLAQTYSPNVIAAGGKGHSETYSTGFIYNAFKPASSTSGATSVVQKNYPVNTVNYLVNNTDAKDKATGEYSKFFSHRNQVNRATMITDFLILQTSSGDQAVMYYQQAAPSAVTCETMVPQLKIAKETMWDNNTNSAARWKADHVNVGGYNGKYSDVAGKFSWTSKGKVPTTYFDPDPAGKIVRPTRPNRSLMLYKGEINIIADNINKSYQTGKGEVFWANSLHWSDRSATPFKNVTDPTTTAPYNTSVISNLINYETKAKHAPEGTAGGYKINAPYSKNHRKTNDIIIHDPVSTEFALVEALPNERDQRIAGTIIGGADDANNSIGNSQKCPREPGLCDFRVLNCTYSKDTILADFDFEDVVNGTVTNKITGSPYKLPTGFTVKSAGNGFTSKYLEAKGTRWAIPFSDLKLDYSTSLTLRVEADVKIPTPSASGTMLFSFYRYDLYIPSSQVYATLNTGNGWERRADTPLADNVNKRVTVDFNFFDINSSKVYINGTEVSYSRINPSTELSSAMIGNTLYVGCWGVDNNYPANYSIDNLKVTRLAGTLNHTAACYRTITLHPDGLNAHQHTVSCLNGIETIVDGMNNGSYTEQQIRDMLGSAYDPIMANSFGPVIHTWNNWSSSNLQGFNAANQVSFGYSGGNIVATSSGNDPIITVPVNFSAKGVSKIEVVMDNNTSSTSAQLLWSRNDAAGFSGSRVITTPIQANTANQTVVFATRFNGEWKNTIDSLRFDLATTAGQLTIKSIKVYGAGTKTAGGTGSSTIYNFGYTGDVQTITLNAGQYKLEAWGAQGGGPNGGKGGYSTGTVTTTEAKTFYIYVGGQGNDDSTYDPQGGYNGGGSGRSNPGGGGATDIRFIPHRYDYEELKTSRLLVAGGGGGTGGRYRELIGGYGGGLEGGQGQNKSGGKGGTQTTGTNLWHGGDGSNYVGKTGGGGGGYYGGYGGDSHGSVGYGAGGGGSSYIGGVTAGQTLAGNETMPAPAGGNQLGHSGNGYARISAMFSPVTITTNTGVVERTWDLTDSWGYNYIPLTPGTYKFEAWGSVGGGWGTSPNNSIPGKGAYTSGMITLDNNVDVAVFVGNNSGYNGGGKSSMAPAGGGATDFRLNVSYHDMRAGYSSGGKSLSARAGTEISGQSAITNASGEGVYGPYIRAEANHTYMITIWGSGLLNGQPVVYDNGGNTNYTSLIKYSTRIDHIVQYTITVPAASNIMEYCYHAINSNRMQVDYITVSDLNSRIMVAGGGGGAEWSGYTGGDGGLNGYAGKYYSASSAYYTTGATQTSGGTGWAPGSFGIGGTDITTTDGGGGGGGGYYGGGTTYYTGGGSGGSSFVSGHSGSNAMNFAGNHTGQPNHYSGLVFTNTQITDGANNTIGRAKITKYKDAVNLQIDATTIRTYWTLLPNHLPNGTVNPLWRCNLQPNNVHICNSNCHDSLVLSCTEPHHKGVHYDGSNDICWDACGNDALHKSYKPVINTADGTFKPGNFINMDYGFRVYFPNTGDYEQGQPHGLGGLTDQRGLGFTDGLDTTEWTRAKRIKFEFNVIYKNKLYLANEWITLGDRGSYNGADGSKYSESNWSNYGKDIFNDIDERYYTFYCVLANYESKSATVEYEVEAINCPGPNDNLNTESNRNRTSSFTALHGGYKTTYIDVVGRVGNLIINDTGDFRYANLFKNPSSEAANIPLEPKTYDAFSGGMSPIGSATVKVDTIISKETNAGSRGPKIDVTEGMYRVDIEGKALNNGRLKLTVDNGNVDWTDKARNIAVATTKMSFYVEVPANSNDFEIWWLANNNTQMEISKLTVTRLGNSAESWLLDGVVKEPNLADQNVYLTWKNDIRGLPIGNKTNYLNTYGTMGWADEHFEQMPLSPDKNNIEILQDDPMLVGYDIYADITTLGNYFLNNSSQIQVVPYYYAFDLNAPDEDRKLIPVDAYLMHEGTYEPINLYDNVKPGWDKTSVYDYIINLDWLEENVRRNYTDAEAARTQFLADYYKEPVTTSDGVVSGYKQLYAPVGNFYTLGNAQLMVANGKSRTFIGGETTYGALMNLGGSNVVKFDDNGVGYNNEGRIPNYLWWQAAQRWHLKLGLPSSTVFVKQGITPDVNTVKEFNSSNYIILCTADIRVIGDTYVLGYNHKGDNGAIRVKNHDGDWIGPIQLPDTIPPVFGVYSTSKSSMFDIEIVGIH